MNVRTSKQGKATIVMTFDIHGIELVKKISKSMDYIRAIDMNNTIISF